MINAQQGMRIQNQFIRRLNYIEFTHSDIIAKILRSLNKYYDLIRDFMIKYEFNNFVGVLETKKFHTNFFKNYNLPTSEG